MKHRLIQLRVYIFIRTSSNFYLKQIANFPFEDRSDLLCSIITTSTLASSRKGNILRVLSEIVSPHLWPVFQEDTSRFLDFSIKVQGEVSRDRDIRC